MPDRRLVCLMLLAALLAACGKKTPSFEDVPPAEDLYAQGEKILEGRRWFWVYTYVDYTEAIDTFQTIIDNYPYSDYAVKAELRIADAYYDDERYEEALSYYRDFSDLHPQHEKVPYTILRSALCHYNQIKSANRDQTATKESLAYLEKLVRRYPYSEETREGEELLRELRTLLAESEMLIGDFYRNSGEYQAAADRYRNVLDSYPGLGLDAEALYKLGVSFEQMQRNDEAMRLFHVIVENFRDTHLAALAADHIAEAQ